LQLQVVKRIGDFIDRPLTIAQAKRIAEKMYSKRSLTYRKGSIGDWRNHFGEQHRQLFAEATEDLVERLGYSEL